MRVTRGWYLGLLLTGTAGAGIGCGGEEPAPVGEASSELHIVKRPKLEAIVKEDDLVSNLAPFGGTHPTLDEHLLNAWGLAFSDRGLAWVASNHDGTDRVYDSQGNLQGAVTIPPAPGHEPPSAPTGQLANPVPWWAFRGDAFIVVSEDGTVVGVQVKHDDHKRDDKKRDKRDMKDMKDMIDAEAFVRVDNSDNTNPDHPAIYKGVAVAFVHGQPRLFATDFHNGKIDVFDADYRQLDTMGGFTDDKLPAGFAPFNVLAVGDRLFVTYALQDDDAEDDVPGPGNGFIDVYSVRGELLQRLLSGDQHPELNSPWGLALSREHKGDVDLLVGNFGDGHINVYDLNLRGKQLRADFEGALGVFKDKKLQPLVISGLWAFAFGNGKGGFDADDIFFTAGPDNGPGTELEENGLFGELDFVSPRL